MPRSSAALLLLLSVSCGGASATSTSASSADVDRLQRSCTFDSDADACVALGDARAGSREPDELARAARAYEKACDVKERTCSHFTDFATRFENACWNEHDAISCSVAGDAREYAPARYVDKPRALALFEAGCELGVGRCSSFHPPNPTQRLGIWELTCIDGKLRDGACASLRDTLAKDFRIQRNADDWLPFFAEAANGTVNFEICAIDPSTCPLGRIPPIPPPQQADAQRQRIIDDHDAKCRAGVLADCEAGVRIKALDLAFPRSKEAMGFSAPRYDPRPDWARLCQAGARTSCLDLGLMTGDESALRRACELGDAFGCTRAAGAALARNDRAGARPWLDRACRLGRTWACR